MRTPAAGGIFGVVGPSGHSKFVIRMTQYEPEDCSKFARLQRRYERHYLSSTEPEAGDNASRVLTVEQAILGISRWVFLFAPPPCGVCVSGST